MEETRRFLTQISQPKLQEIMKELQTNMNLQHISAISPSELQWIEQVLLYMIGDGKRKNELGGFVLSHKGVVRGAINKAVQCRSDIEHQARKEAVAVANNNNKESSKSEVTYEMQRDVRQIDEERQRARTAAVHALVDDALLKKN
jgi:hypothetical protein